MPLVANANTVAIPLEALWALMGLGSCIYFLEPVSFLKQFLFETISFSEQVVYWTSFFISYKTKKKTACGLYYKYKVSIKKSLLYATSRRKKMLPLIEKLLWDATCRRNFRKALFSETQKCPLNRQICPFGYL